MVELVRRSPIAFATLVLFSCSAFSGSDLPADDSDGGRLGRDDDGGDTASDGGSTFDAGIGVGPTRPDAGVNTEVGGFCSAYPTAIACFDFDGTFPTSGLAFRQKNGSASFVSTFDSGSPPKALQLATTAMGGISTATAATITLAGYQSKTISIDVQFALTSIAPNIEYIARMNFDNASYPIAFDSGGGLQCAGQTFVKPAVGVHALNMTVTVDDAGKGAFYGCTVDGIVGASVPLPTPTTLDVELGDASSGGGSYAVSYDNVLIRTR